MRFSTHCGLFASWRVSGLGWVQLWGWKVHTEACLRRIARLGRKRQGEWAELVFMARGTGEGFLVSRPWGDSAPHDVGVDWKKLRWRVQVKSTLWPRRGENSFRVGLIGPGGEPYSAGMVDFVAVYLGSVDGWYIFPLRVLRGRNNRKLRNIQITPGSKRGRWEGYREKWGLFRGRKKRR